ncbi:MAG: NYN domain-containing protein [Boseongicola sp. SB0662_bin_57]|nr:NYN domain-containing protein [Boseongicola sp. SB0662_bin_57]
MTQHTIRIGVFYDGSYFALVSDYYRYHHPRQARISIAGFHDFLRHEIANRAGEDTPSRFCHIVEAHYYRGRFAAEDTDREPGRLLRERKFDDALMKARVTTHFMPMAAVSDGRVRERGIDVLLTLDAHEAAISKKIDFIVLVTGDGDFVPLAERLNSLNCSVVVAAWDVQSASGDLSVRTAQALLDAVPHPIMMQTIIEDRVRRSDPLVNGLFMDSRFRSPTSDSPRSKPHGGEQMRSHSEEVSSQGDETDTGVIVNLPSGRDFGFIAPDRGGENLFFHSSWVHPDLLMSEETDGITEPFQLLSVGDCVEFKIGENSKTGQPIAMDVTFVERPVVC